MWNVIIIVLLLVFGHVTTRGEESGDAIHHVVQGEESLGPRNTGGQNSNSKRAPYVGPVTCYREELTPELDVKILMAEMVEARLQIQEGLALLERFYIEVDRGMVQFNSTCLYAYHQFMNSAMNLEGLRTCTDQFEALYLDALTDTPVDNTTTTLSI